MFASQSQEDTEVSGEFSETITNYGVFVKGSLDGRYDFRRIMEDDGKGSLLLGCLFLIKERESLC
jgi:hypothetical protein